MKKNFMIAAAAGLVLSASSLLASEKKEEFAIVNFATCMAESKHGKKEQENFENLRKQVVSMIEETEKELRSIAEKFEDPDLLDSLSPKAEEELKVKYQALNEDLARYQNQYYQVLQHAQMQSVQKVNLNVAQAAEKIAKERNLSYVLNKEFCFYYNPSLEITNQVIDQMDNSFDLEEKQRELSEKEALKDQDSEVAQNDEEFDDFEFEDEE